jgi:enoyl-CoA hydratase/carnithine racemase
MSSQNPERLQIREAADGVLVATSDEANYGLVGPAQDAQLLDLVQRADRDPAVRAVILTGAHPERFVSHADVDWLQQGGAASPAVGRPIASVIGYLRDSDEHGELGFYASDAYLVAQQRGTMSAHTVSPRS